VAWLPWALGAAALLPPVARRLAGPLARLGDWLAGSRVLASLAVMTAGGALAWLLPDRVRFVGDFLLRQGTVEQVEKPSIIFPQAMPLDLLIHYRAPLRLVAWGIADAGGAARLIGAIEAALFALLALAFARALGRRGVSAAATAALVFFGGYLGMFTGYSKGFSELMLVTVLAGVAGLRALRTGSGLLALGIAAALGVALHRSALSLVPALVVAWALALPRARAAGWRPGTLAALAIPAVTIAAFLPRILADIRRWDTVHFNPAEVQTQGGALRAALAGGRALDLLNLLVLLSPLALAAMPAALPLGRGPASDRAPRRGRELAFLGALALPFVVAAPFIHPAQGLFRDWDDFAAAGVAVSLVAAWLAGEALAGAPRYAWVGVAVVVSAALPSLQWLAHHASLERGLARVEAFMSEPPERSPAERAKTWDYLGIVHYRHERWSEAAAAFARSAATGPSERVLTQWAMSATNAGDLAGALATYRRLVALYPDATLGWLGLAVVSSRLAEAEPDEPTRAVRVAESRRAAHALLALQPRNADALRLLDYLERRYGPEAGGSPR